MSADMPIGRRFQSLICTRCWMEWVAEVSGPGVSAITQCQRCGKTEEGE